VVKLIHLCLNSKFDMSVVFTVNYFFSGRRRPRRQRDALGDRFRESQDQTGSVFECAHSSMVCVHVFIRVNTSTCMSICICTRFLKKK
jgi:hypothetical protein